MHLSSFIKSILLCQCSCLCGRRYFCLLTPLVKVESAFVRPDPYTHTLPEELWRGWAVQWAGTLPWTGVLQSTRRWSSDQNLGENKGGFLLLLMVLNSSSEFIRKINICIRCSKLTRFIIFALYLQDCTFTNTIWSKRWGWGSITGWFFPTRKSRFHLQHVRRRRRWRIEREKQGRTKSIRCISPFLILW